jgi:DNA-binding NarL/FixJ family response regulator
VEKSAVVRVRSVAATVSADASQPGLLIALDARIPGLLLAGLTDQAVANQLNLSMRMVQLRVRGLMDLVSADTRLQLGFHAARKGWI